MRKRERERERDCEVGMFVNVSITIFHRRPTQPNPDNVHSIIFVIVITVLCFCVG